MRLAYVFALFTITQCELPFAAHFVSIREIMNDKNIGQDFSSTHWMIKGDFISDYYNCLSNES